MDTETTLPDTALPDQPSATANESAVTDLSTTAALEVRDLWTGYNKEPVLTGVSFRVERGAMVGVIGPNGSGKSTLIKTILGLIKPWRGEISVLGESGQAQRRKIGYTPQTEAVDWDFPVTVADVALMGRYSGRGIFRRTTAEDRDASMAALQKVSMFELRDRLIGELSGGQRRRVLLARALAHNPELLLLDEPMAGLDATAQHQLLDLFDQLRANDGATVVLSTHDLSCVSSRCDQAACLNRRLVAFGPPSEVLNEKVLGETFGTHLLLVHLDGQAYDYQHHTHNGPGNGDGTGQGDGGK
jgi:manganese/iron transport system ATP-binding protein